MKASISDMAWLRTKGSNAATRLGVSTRERIRRCSSWRGGSIWNMLSGSKETSVSTRVPAVEVKVFQSAAAASTSAALDSIQ
jgi:hypothetical protein